MSKLSVLICLSFGTISILQTLNAKFLFKMLAFNYYSFIFLLQRIINIVVVGSLVKWSFNTKHLLYTIPYSIIMCSTNILSSFCITVMPLQSFISFKKFLILFVITFALIRKTMHSLPPYKLVSLGLITSGGIMLGMYANSSTIGYISSFSTNLLQAISLEYCSYMYLVLGISPPILLFYNSIISLPYYLAIILYQGQAVEIFNYISDPPSMFFYSCICMIILGSLSELSANYITMLISPFEKATVSNVKDLFILLISVKLFHELELISMNQIGIFLCLIGSAMFSMPKFLEKDKGKEVVQITIPEPEAEDLFQLDETLKINIDTKLQNNESSACTEADQ